MTTIKFNYALYRNDQAEERMYVDQILRHQEYLEIKEELYCPGLGCDAKLSLTRLSNGTNYLRKHKSYQHSESCDYLESDEVGEKSTTEYISENGRMTDEGISRRKRSAMDTLKEYLNPSDPVGEDSKPKRKYIKKKETNEKSEVKFATRVIYDPDAEIIQKSDKNGGTKVMETRFYERMPFQISINDSNKNLKTSAVIEDFIFDESNRYVEIKTSLENVKVKFILPEAFFNNSRSRLVPDELMGYLKTISDYMAKSDKEIFLTTMCQSQRINLEDITLWIFEPEFMSFQTRNGDEFTSLTNFVIAIQTKSI